MLKVIIADDEPHICMDVERILKEDKDIEIVAICHTGNEALENICNLDPDMVFLDISMPGIDGIKLGHHLKHTNFDPYIVYLTAYDKFAVEAFKVGAKGYILKPFMDNDLVEQIKLAREYVIEKEKQKETGKNEFAVDCDDATDFICGRDNEQIIPVKKEDLTVVFAQDREVYLKTNDLTYITNYSLTQLGGKLDSKYFFQCHRNYLVNLYKIKSVVPWFNGTYLLTMNDKENTEVPVSRSKVKQLKKLLNIN